MTKTKTQLNINMKENLAKRYALKQVIEALIDIFNDDNLIDITKQFLAVMEHKDNIGDEFDALLSTI